MHREKVAEDLLTVKRKTKNKLSDCIYSDAAKEINSK